MRKIINGKVYDTESAKLIGKCDNGDMLFEINYYGESLYRKRTGEYFLLAEGGARTPDDDYYGSAMWFRRGRIIPLTYEAAREWAGKHLRTDLYEAIFGEISEDAGRANVTLSLSVSAAQRARQAAEKAGISLSAYIEGLI